MTNCLGPLYILTKDSLQILLELSIIPTLNGMKAPEVSTPKLQVYQEEELKRTKTLHVLTTLVHIYYSSVCEFDRLRGLKIQEHTQEKTPNNSRALIV